MIPKKAILSIPKIRDALVASVTGAAAKVGNWLDFLNELPEPQPISAIIQQMAATLPDSTAKALKPSAVKPAKVAKASVLKPAKAEKPAKPAKASKPAKPAKVTKTANSDDTKKGASRTKPTLPQALAIVMGTKVMGTADLIPLVEARGWAPKSKNGLAQYFSVILSSNNGPGKIFERVGTGKYKVQNPAQFTALSKQYGGKSSGKADRVTTEPADVEDIEVSEESVVSDPPSNPVDDVDEALESLITGTGFTTDVDGFTED
jgi:hypothetical protein